jgi:hypothetical protein
MGNRQIRWLPFAGVSLGEHLGYFIALDPQPLLGYFYAIGFSKKSTLL